MALGRRVGHFAGAYVVFRCRGFGFKPWWCSKVKAARRLGCFEVVPEGLKRRESRLKDSVQGRKTL